MQGSYMAKKKASASSHDQASPTTPRQDTGLTARWHHSDFEDSSPDEPLALKFRRVFTVAGTLLNAGAISSPSTPHSTSIG